MSKKKESKVEAIKTPATIVITGPASNRKGTKVINRQILKIELGEHHTATITRE